MSWDKFIFKIFLTFKLLIFFNFLSKIAKRWSNPTTFILILIIGHNKPPKVICLKLFPKSHSSPFFKFHFNRIPIRLIRFHSFIWARNWDWSLLFMMLNGYFIFESLVFIRILFGNHLLCPAFLEINSLKFNFVSDNN